MGRKGLPIPIKPFAAQHRKRTKYERDVMSKMPKWAPGNPGAIKGRKLAAELARERKAAQKDAEDWIKEVRARKLLPQ
jgi:hypothetical protein